LSAAGSWTKFVHCGSAIPTATTDLRIEVVGASRRADFGRVVQLGFEAPPPFAEWAAQLAGRPRWTCLVAYSGDLPVAGGALYLDRGLGWAGLGCCIATHRRRGAQSALLAKRIAWAKDQGARAVVSETGTPAAEAPGPHPSFHNLTKMGFVQAYRRINFRPREQLQ
jgi:GNAT superfamily N-acetyltransferase